MKKFVVMLTVIALVFSLAGCGSAGQTTTETKNKEVEITIAYQSSVGYAPLLVMKDQKLIEQEYGEGITVNWKEMKNGAEINEGLVSGALDVGTMGVPVAVTGIMAGSPYRIAFGLSAQPYSILSSSDNIHSLSDITPKDQIAITNINSQPHILLAMAAKAELGDAHALDNNLTVLSNADGYAAMISGAVNCHMVISPYNFMELANDEVSIHEIEISNDIWPEENTALVGVATQRLHDEKPEVYQAVIKAMDKAMVYIAAEPDGTAKLLSESYDADADDIKLWITDRRSSYDTKLHGVMNMVKFMDEEGFLDNSPSSLEEMIYDGVQGD